MAQTAATKTSDFAGYLPAAKAEDYFKEAARQSVIQSLVRRVPLGINGQEITTVTAKPRGKWIGETEQKPTTGAPEIGVKGFKPHKLACISVVSAEVVRANPLNYMEVLKSEISEAFAIAFDLAALYGMDQDGAAADPFGMYINKTAKEVELGTSAAAEGGIIEDFNLAIELLVNAKRRMSGVVMDTMVEPILNRSVDTSGRPFLTDGVYENGVLVGGRILGRPARMSDYVADFREVGAGKDGTGALGFAGDFRKAVWGAVGGISFDVSTQATVTIGGTLTSLWEHNLVAIRAEAEYGFMMNDATGGDFVRLVNKVA